MKIARIGITANVYKEGMGEMVSQVVGHIPEDIEVVCTEELSSIELPARMETVDDLCECDAVIAIGGDGTLLRASRLVEQEEIPLLGIKMKSLGFLTEDDPALAIGELVGGTARIQERMRLEVTTGGEEPETYTALNDLVIHGVGVSRVLHIRTKVDGVMMGEYLSDGVIISTPTGSTAYSLAAGGPIVNPVTMEAIVVTPLCPHSLSVRPVVMSADEVLGLEIVEEGQETMMTIDGQQSARIMPGETVTVKRSARVTRLVTCRNYDYYDLVRRKLRWGGVLRKER